MTMPEAIRPIAVFDLDGTLADTASDLLATLNIILAQENLPPLPIEGSKTLIGAGAKTLIGAGAKALIERGFLQSGISINGEKLELLFKKFLEEYDNRLCVDTKLFPGVLEALDTMREAGIVLAVCTNKFESHTIKLLEMLGIKDRFAFIAGRDTFPFHKPDPRHLTETISRAGADQRLAVMVGDSNTDITTARRANIPAIGVSFGYTDIPIRDLQPDLVVDHYVEMANAVETLLRRNAERHFTPEVIKDQFHEVNGGRDRD